MLSKHTGHTDESISIVICDRAFGDEPVGVFTGDTLFVSDVGRSDFFPDRSEEVAGNLFDSLFDKLLPLGDQVIIYPAHGGRVGLRRRDGGPGVLHHRL